MHIKKVLFLSFFSRRDEEKNRLRSLSLRAVVQQSRRRPFSFYILRPVNFFLSFFFFFSFFVTDGVGCCVFVLVNRHTQHSSTSRDFWKETKFYFSLILFFFCAKKKKKNNKWNLSTCRQDLSLVSCFNDCSRDWTGQSARLSPYIHTNR